MTEVFRCRIDKRLVAQARHTKRKLDSESWQTSADSKRKLDSESRNGRQTRSRDSDPKVQTVDYQPFRAHLRNGRARDVEVCHIAGEIAAGEAFSAARFAEGS